MYTIFVVFIQDWRKDYTTDFVQKFYKTYTFSLKGCMNIIYIIINSFMKLSKSTPFWTKSIIFSKFWLLIWKNQDLGMVSKTGFMMQTTILYYNKHFDIKR